MNIITYKPGPIAQVALDALEKLSRYQLAVAVPRPWEKELQAISDRLKDDYNDADHRRDLVAYDEVFREMGPEIANREARPPIEVRQRVDAAVQRLLDSVGYQHDAARAE